MKLLKPLIVTALTLVLLSYLLPTVSYLNWTTIVLASLVLTILQKLIRPVLNILFLPVNIITLGLFSVVINVFLLWLVTFLVPGLEIKPMIIGSVSLNQFFSLLVISFLISLSQSVLSFLL